MRNLTINAITEPPAPRWHRIGTGALMVAVALAAVLEPPTAYLVPIAVSAWILAIATARRQYRPRYRRR